MTKTVQAAKLPSWSPFGSRAYALSWARTFVDRGEAVETVDSQIALAAGYLGQPRRDLRTVRAGLTEDDFRILDAQASRVYRARGLPQLATRFLLNLNL